MNASRNASRRPAWARWLAGAAVWFALLVWAYGYRMPYDLRMGIFLGCFAATAVLGLGIGGWKNFRSPKSGRPVKRRWELIRGTLGYGLGLGVLAGIPVFALLIGCNGTWRSREPFIVDGTVVACRVTSGRGTSYLVTVHENHPERTLRFSLDREKFLHTRVGDPYHEEFQVGLLGWPCRPR